MTLNIKSGMSKTQHSLDELVRQYEQINGRVGQLEGDLSAMLDRRKEAVKAIYAAKYGIREGVKVQYRGKEFIVCEVEVNSYYAHSKPWIYGNTIKKDGTASAQRRYLGTFNPAMLSRPSKEGEAA